MNRTSRNTHTHHTHTHTHTNTHTHTPRIHTVGKLTVFGQAKN